MRGMKNSRRVSTQIMLLQLGIVLITLMAAAVVVMRVEVDRVEESAFERVQTVALETAQLSAVQEAITLPAEQAASVIAPLAHLAESASGVDYVTVVNMDGIRVAHPEASQIGRPVSSDHESIREGQSFRGVEQGPLGVTLRVKEPIYAQSEVVGTISVGILQSNVRANLADVVWAFAPWIILAAALGTTAAAFVARAVRRIYGVAPEQVSSLLQAQQAVLYSVSDGVLGVDAQGRLSLINEEAKRLLNLPKAEVGQDAAQLLDEDVLQLLRSDAPDAEAVQNVLSGERVLIATRREAVLGTQRYGRTLTLSDHTELEDTLRELRGQRGLTDTLRAQAHEFTNRLHLISGLLSIGEYAEAQEYLRVFSGASESTPERLLGDPLLAALITAKQAVAREAGVQLQLHPNSQTAPGFSAGPDELTAASNLISNAIEAAGDGGTAMVRINAGPGGSRFEVCDSGPGLHPGEAEQAVQLGYSSKPSSGATGGRGIGLTLVDRITRRRGGVLEFEASELGGARIIAAWPPHSHLATQEHP